MSYDRPNRMMYSFGNFDFGGAGNETFSIQGPKGKKGRLYDYGVYGVIEAFAGDTTPMMSVGTPSDADAYGEEFDFGALADNSGKSVRSTYDESADKTEFDAVMVDRNIPADQEIVVTCVAATGTPTGQGVPFVVIDWDD